MLLVWMRGLNIWGRLAGFLSELWGLLLATVCLVTLALKMRHPFT